MFQKLRSDLLIRLGDVKALLVNAEGFAGNGDTGNGILAEGRNLLDALSVAEVICIAYSESTSQEISSVAEALGIELHQNVSDPGAFYDYIKNEHSLQDGDIALICRDCNDIQVAKRVNMPVASSGAPLEVKSEAYYACYHDGPCSVSELAELIITAKTYPGGWSE